MDYAQNPRQRGSLENRLSQLVVKVPVKITWKQMWFGFTAVGTPPEQIDQQPNAVSVSLWKALKPE